MLVWADSAGGTGWACSRARAEVEAEVGPGWNEGEEEEAAPPLLCCLALPLLTE